MGAEVFNLSRDPEAAPILKLASQIIKDAIALNADAILMELDVELHLKVQQEMAALNEALEKKSITADRCFFELGKLPGAFHLTHIIDGKSHPAPSGNGELFGHIVRIFLLTMDIPPWTKDEISASFETIKPVSRWTFKSKDLTRRVEFKRIRRN
jgi:hypothetical protein